MSRSGGDSYDNDEDTRVCRSIRPRKEQARVAQWWMVGGADEPWNGKEQKIIEMKRLKRDSTRLQDDGLCASVAVMRSRFFKVPFYMINLDSRLSNGKMNRAARMTTLSTSLFCVLRDGITTSQQQQLKAWAMETFLFSCSLSCHSSFYESHDYITDHRSEWVV